MEMKDIVDKFLCWKLPTDFAPDCGITFTNKPDARGYAPAWPTGTNLLMAYQAEAMLREIGVASLLEEIARLKEFRLQEQSRESVEARFYRYLRDEAGQYPEDRDGPMICYGLGDLFDYLRGEECDQAIREAIDRREAAGAYRRDEEGK